MKDGTTFDPELVELMNLVLTAVWDSLPEFSQRRMSKAIIAERIMEAVGDGERDRIVLRAAALKPHVIQMIADPRGPRTEMQRPTVRYPADAP